MQHAVEKFFRREKERARQSYRPTSPRYIEQDIGLEAHVQRQMPLFLTLRDREGNGLVTAMLPPGGQEDTDFRTIVVGSGNGDPYPEQCKETAVLLAKELGLADDRWLCSFQSRFGKEEWIKPYTDETLKAWGAEKLASVDVICPGFSADCLETIEEIDEENREYFEEGGGGQYRYIPALNERGDHLDALAAIARRALG